MEKLHFLKGIHIPFTKWGVEVLYARGMVDGVESKTGRGRGILISPIKKKRSGIIDYEKVTF